MQSKILISGIISVKNKSWVFGAAFIGMGVTINKGAVVGATASVYKVVNLGQSLVEILLNI